MIVLLKLLLTSVNHSGTNANTTTQNSNDSGEREKASSVDSIDNHITLEYIEQVDTVRNKEVYAKSISGILMILLKWAKSSRTISKDIPIFFILIYYMYYRCTKV
jgi:hypothetical protein